MRPAPLGTGPALYVVTSHVCFLSEAVYVVVYLVCNVVLNVSIFLPRYGQITVMFRDAVVVVSVGF